MIRREIEIDEDTDQLLELLTAEYDGNTGAALSDLIRSHASVEAFLDSCEESSRDCLLVQVERAEKGFRESRFMPWDEVKRRNNL